MHSSLYYAKVTNHKTSDMKKESSVSVSVVQKINIDENVTNNRAEQNRTLLLKHPFLAVITPVIYTPPHILKVFWV